MEPKEEPNDADCITSYDNFLSVICGVNVMDILEDGKVNKYNSTEGMLIPKPLHFSPNREHYISLYLQFISDDESYSNMYYYINDNTFNEPDKTLVEFILETFYQEFVETRLSFLQSRMPDINHEINELMGFQEDSYE